MAQMLLIMGESGTGKSTSMRNCDPATTAVVNPVGKPLPFKEMCIRDRSYFINAKRFAEIEGIAI